MKRLISYSVAALFGLAVIAEASEPEMITWQSLIPPVETYEDPFAELGNDEIRSLAKLLRLQMSLEESPNSQMQAEADGLREGLIEQGLDVDWLFEQRLEIMEKRRRAGTAPNDSLLDQNVRLPGYILPLKVKDGKTIEFLLVPTVGACIHTPPPPANQMVLVSYPAGFKPEGLYSPIWITGTMRSEFTSKELYMVDGEMVVDVTYQMTADNVEAY